MATRPETKNNVLNPVLRDVQVPQGMRLETILTIIGALPLTGEGRPVDAGLLIVFIPSDEMNILVGKSGTHSVVVFGPPAVADKAVAEIEAALNAHAGHAPTDGGGSQ